MTRDGAHRTAPPGQDGRGGRIDDDDKNGSSTASHTMLIALPSA